ncbi:hypothetical protein EDD61_1289 [Longicatena caecimuris]|uniref:Uncharacterized protein n=1 Tax=Longicatena caecimuris TaxID=1796635 RepID=A0A4R3SY84_9FIRM|nr:hypothetical protein EDD61_1289 [Longicatena caecimuris]
MEIAIIYIWTMLLTGVIGLGTKPKGGIFISKYMKWILLIPVRKGTVIPRYIIIIRALMQLATIICIIYLAIKSTTVEYRDIQKMYGMFMGGVCPLLTVVCSKIF